MAQLARKPFTMGFGFEATWLLWVTFWLAGLSWTSLCTDEAIGSLIFTSSGPMGFLLVADSMQAAAVHDAVPCQPQLAAQSPVGIIIPGPPRGGPERIASPLGFKPIPSRPITTTQ
ncbi:hypothetical protein PtB15_7B564 [Puccinia triticina]|nr:hypothetical protein PtB15_7B564 [Puccinia triticina]